MKELTPQVEFLNREYFKNKRDGYFVDIGANDGVNASNSHYLETVLGWNGVCVEPLPNIYEILVKNRNCKCLNVAITEEAKYYDFLQINSIRRPEIYIDMLSGIVDYYDERHINRIDKEVIKENGSKTIIKVKGETFNIIEQIDIDYVSIDTEGNELSILKSIDFDKYNIFAFSVENNYNDQRNINYMISMGYKHIKDIGLDNIFIKNKK